LWTPRSGDWSIVFMNADVGAGVAVHGDAGAKLPILPWVALGLLLTAGAAGVISGLVLVRTIRKGDETPPQPDESQGSTIAHDPVGAFK